MVNPKIMCNQHLRGEHVEHHMLVGSLKKKISLDGYVRSNCLQLTAIQERHDTIASEMISRGMKHESPLIYDPSYLDYLPMHIICAVVDVDASLQDLITRCPDCRSRYYNLMKGNDV